MNDNDNDETPDFKTADQKIFSLTNRLVDKGMCPCCTARALAYHAMSLAKCAIGREETIELFEDISIPCARRGAGFRFSGNPLHRLAQNEEPG
jgi:hypothetical protein